LNLENNQIGNEGARYLADALKINNVRIVFHLILLIIISFIFIQTLTELNISCNHIDDEGAKHLADALITNNVIFMFFFHTILYLLSLKYTDTD